MELYSPEEENLAMTELLREPEESDAFNAKSVFSQVDRDIETSEGESRRL